MGYPGEQGQSGGRHPSSPPPENTPYNANDPYSFSPAQGAAGAYEGGFEGSFTEPYEGQEGTGYGDSASQEPNPYAPGAFTSQNQPSQNQPSQNASSQSPSPQGGRRNSLSAQPPSGYGDGPAGYGDTPGSYGDAPSGYGESQSGYSDSQGTYGTQEPSFTESPNAFGGGRTAAFGVQQPAGAQPEPYSAPEGGGYDAYSPQSDGAYGAQDGGTYGPQDGGAYGPQDGGAYGPQGHDPYSPQNDGPYGSHGDNPYSPQSDSSYGPQDNGSYGPQGGAFGSDGMGPYEPSSFEIQPRGQAGNGSFPAGPAGPAGESDDQHYGRHSSPDSAGNSAWGAEEFGSPSPNGYGPQGGDGYGQQGASGFGAQEPGAFQQQGSEGYGFGPYEPGDAGAQSTNGHGPRHAGAFGAEEPPWATQDPDGDPYTFRSAAAPSADQSETHAWNEHPNGGGPVESFSFQPGGPPPGEVQQGGFQGGMGPYDQTTFDQQPYDQQGLEQQGFDQQAYDKTTFDQQPYGQHAYDGGPYGPGPEHSNPEFGPNPGYGPQGGFGGPGGSGEFGPGPGYGGGQGSGGGNRKKVLVIGGAAAGAVVILAGAIFLMTSGGGSSKKSASGDHSQSQPSDAPSTPQATPTPSIDPNAPLGEKLKSRTTDPDPLTTDEVFKNASFGGYTMVISSTSADCTKEVAGSDLKAALKKGKCTQLLRATYKTTDGKLIGTVGIANLSTAATAKAAEKAGAERTSWLLPLPGGSGATKKIGADTAIARGTAQAEGHYLVMTWVQRPDGKAFASSQTGAISDFVTKVPLGSNLDNALQYRGISGKPYGT